MPGAPWLPRTNGIRSAGLRKLYTPPARLLCVGAQRSIRWQPGCVRTPQPGAVAAPTLPAQDHSARRTPAPPPGHIRGIFQISRAQWNSASPPNQVLLSLQAVQAEAEAGG